MPATIGPRHLAELRRRLSDAVIAPGAATYDDARRVWNGRIETLPGALVRPVDATEVALALRLARGGDVGLAIRPGAHSPTGFSSTSGGLVIDMTAMRGVTVDPAARTARANGGALLGELDVAAQ